MPFTLSHAIVALPFQRTALVPSAIALGAMVPDLPLFYPVFPVLEAYRVTHSWWGAVSIDLALAAVLFVTWRMCVRPTVTALAPGALRSRLPVEWRTTQAATIRRPRDLALLVLSLVLGSISHVVWDLFTHPERAGSEWLPALARMWGPLAGYDWLQYASSVLGIVILGVAGIVWLRGRQAVPAPSTMPRWLFAASWSAAALTLVCVAAVDLVEQGAPGSISGYVFRVMVPALAVEMALLFAVSIAYFSVTKIRHARDADKFARTPGRT